LQNPLLLVISFLGLEGLVFHPSVRLLLLIWGSPYLFMYVVSFPLPKMPNSPAVRKRHAILSSDGKIPSFCQFWPFTLLLPPDQLPKGTLLLEGRSSSCFRQSLEPFFYWSGPSVPPFPPQSNFSLYSKRDGIVFFDCSGKSFHPVPQVAPFPFASVEQRRSLFPLLQQRTLLSLKPLLSSHPPKESPAK